MAKKTHLGTWLALFLASALVGRTAYGQALKKTAPEARETQVYANGTLSPGWHDASKGCMLCLWSSTLDARNGSTASLSAAVAAWGSLVIVSDNRTYARNCLLDLWAKGSGLTAISLYLQDSKTNTLTSDVRFADPQLDEAVVSVLETDLDGWSHIQVNLNKLSSTATTFDRIVATDVSGMGFRLLLDDVKLLYSTENLQKFQASSFVSQTTQAARVLPVFGQDYTTLISAPNRYIVKLRKSTRIGDVDKICQQLAGKLTSFSKHFQGLCHTPVSTLGTLAAPSSSVKWPLMTVSVRSESDLDAMRKSLGAEVEYFEADLQAFTSIRQLMDVASTSKPAWATDVNSGLQDWKPTPVVELNITKNSHVGNDNVATITHIGGAYSNTASNQPMVHSTFTQIGVTPLNNDHVATLPVEEPTAVETSKTDNIKDSVQDDSSTVGTAEGTASIQSVASWGLDRIDQTSLPLNGYYSSGDYDGRGVHIYILDTGARVSHSDFRGRVGDGASAVGTSTDDENGHGTHVAGTALGAVHGVARSAILHVVKVFGADGSGSYSNIIAGMQWVKNHKLRNNIQSAVISMSLVGPRAASLNDAVEEMVAAGITVVTAAGNNRGADACTMSPSSAPSSITVGASTDRDSLASFSNIGKCVNLFAPGQSITSASRISDDAETTMSGTSMATPLVAGVAALYLQYRPGASPAEVKAALTGAAVGAFFESSSPQLLVNAMSSRLRAAGPRTPSTPVVTAPSSTTTPPAAATPTPTTSPPPAPKPSPSPSPKPATPTVGAPAFPSFGSFSKPSWCSTCSWCLGCS